MAREFHAIRKRGHKWVVVAKHSGRILGRHDTRDEALQQLRAVERSIHMRHNPSEEEGYQGWANYETWNVALWIGNDEGLYHLAKEYSHRAHPYADFARELVREFNSKETPDGVLWLDPDLDYQELDTMMEEL